MEGVKMSKKTFSIILVVVGVLGFVAALVMGVVGYPHPGFGYYKITLAVVGAVVAAAGLVTLLGKKKTEGK
jgi:uncharacterized membrane protein YeaQ/YmgE (transglycosylase-associated protein family)